MKLRIAVAWCLFFTLESLAVNAQIGNSSAMTDRYGSLFTFSAKNLKFAETYVFQNSKYFTGTGTRFNTNTNSNESKSVNDFGTVIGINFGLGDNFDLIFNGNFVQTQNRAPSVPKKDVVGFFTGLDVPDDFYLNLRWIAADWQDGKYRMGFMFSRKFEGSGFSNSPFQDYSAASPEVALTLLSSYFQKPMAEESGIMAHLNIQYRNNLDNGKYIGWRKQSEVRENLRGTYYADTIGSVKSNTSSLRVGFGLNYPLIVSGRYLFLMGDLYSTIYLTKPPQGAYSRQNYGYVALGARYQVTDWMGVHVGGDFQVLKGTDKTVSSINLQVEDLTISKSDYPSWHFYAGATFPLSPRSRVFADAGAGEAFAQQTTQKKNEVRDILYSEQEIQKRSQNFLPLKEMRRGYKTIIGNLNAVLIPKDKKPVEPDYSNEEENQNQNQ